MRLTKEVKCQTTYMTKQLRLSQLSKYIPELIKVYNVIYEELTYYSDCTPKFPCNYYFYYTHTLSNQNNYDDSLFAPMCNITRPQILSKPYQLMFMMKA